MHDPANGLRRITLLRTSVDKGKKRNDRVSNIAAPFAAAGYYYTQRCSSILRVSRDSASRFSKLFTPVCLWWLPQALVWKKQEARTPSTSTPTTWKKRPQLSACYVPMKPKEKR